MSTRKDKVMSLEDKVRIIRMYETLNHRSEKRGFKILYSKILTNRAKILAQYDDMKAKLAAVRDLVITEYGKPNYIGEKHAFLEKVICEWYQRAEALPEIKKVSMALVAHKTDIALRILNITDLPLSETQICYLKSKCHKASLERKSKFESKTLSIKKIAQELLVQMGISESAALSMYGPNIFEGPDDDEDDVDFLRRTLHARNQLGKRKLKQAERAPLPTKSPRTSNEKDVWGLEQDLTELFHGDVNESEEEDTSSTQSKVEVDNENEEEDFELYDVISVEDSTEDYDAATSTKNIIPDLLIKKECEPLIDSEAVVPCTLIKLEPDEGQSAESYSIDGNAVPNVQERVEDWLIKTECETTYNEGDNQQATLKPICSIKIENEASDEYRQNCDGMPTTTYVQNCVKEETEEANSDDEEGSAQLFTLTRERNSSDTGSAAPSIKIDGCMENDQDAIRSLDLLKDLLQQ